MAAHEPRLRHHSLQASAMTDPAHARAIYRAQYRDTRRKAHGAKQAPVDYAKFAARMGFYITYGKRVGMTADRIWKGLDCDSYRI